jgi:hypothetical protein
MSSKIIWGPPQTLSVWVVDNESVGSEWKIRRDEHFQQLVKDRWGDEIAILVVDVISKHATSHATSVNASSSHRHASGVTTGEGSGIPPNNAEGTCDTCSPPAAFVPPDIAEPVNWDELIIHQDKNHDGDATAAANEDDVYEAMGFRAVDVQAEIPIPTMTAEIHHGMHEVAILVDDNANEEPVLDWDRDNPDLSVGVTYPSMKDLRLAVKQHAIVKKFELATGHSDTTRYRTHCASLGCPWIFRAATNHDGSVRVYFLVFGVYFYIFTFFSCIWCTYACFFYPSADSGE